MTTLNMTRKDRTICDGCGTTVTSIRETDKWGFWTLYDSKDDWNDGEDLDFCTACRPEIDHLIRSKVMANHGEFTTILNQGDHS